MKIQYIKKKKSQFKQMAQNHSSFSWPFHMNTESKGFRLLLPWTSFLSDQWQVTLTAVFNSINMWPIVLDCLAIDFT